MSNRKWNKGKPPHVGFWLTDFDGAAKGVPQWRWWDGDWYSCPIPTYLNIRAVEDCSARNTMFTYKCFVYSDYWPENARVPRINPNKEKK